MMLFSIWIGISPPEALSLGIFLMTFSTSLTETGWKENFSFIKYLFLILIILQWFLNFLMILVSISSVKSSLFEGHSKVSNFSTVSAKCLLNVLAISSLFTNKVSFSTISFVFVVISSFSIRIILESPVHVC